MAGEADNMVLRLLREMREKQEEQGREIAALRTALNEHGRILEGIVRMLGELTIEIAVLRADVARVKARQDRMEMRLEHIAAAVATGFHAIASRFGTHDARLASARGERLLRLA